MKKDKNVAERYGGRYKKHLLSDQNIYHAIYSLKSYIFNFELLDDDDKEQYYRLQDKYDEFYIKETIEKVKRKIKELIEYDDSFIETKVYFRPKKVDEDGNVTYRPLHTTDIISQIAIVAMLHLLVYEIADEEKKLFLSNVSRLLPGNFYGNRVSLNPETLFKPWKQQYQMYTQNVNEALKKYNASLEYQYEVTLDLENFFPTIHPMLIYQLIWNRLPVNMAQSDRQLMERILIKLLYCKLKTKLSDKLKTEYYKTLPRSDFKFVCGIPQGLPQSYFFGNICMIPISEIFQKHFQGVSYFYVDDSVIFTNDVNEDEFGIQLDELNFEIKEKEKEFLNDYNRNIIPKGADGMEDIYGIHVHGLDEKKGISKSCFTRLDRLDKSEIYLKCISREASQVGNEIFRMYSDEEDVILEKRMGIISSEIQKKIDELDQKQKQLDVDSKVLQMLKKSRDRWNRYYRFFTYRKQRLSLRRMTEDGTSKKDDTISKKELEEIIYAAAGEELTREETVKAFMQSYNENIWAATVTMYCEYADDKEKKQLGQYISKLNGLCFEELNETSSYFYKVYQELIEFGKNKVQEICSKNGMVTVEPYRSLKYYAKWKLKAFSHKHHEVVEHWVAKIQEKNWSQEIVGKLLSADMLEIAGIVSANTSQFVRMVANAVYSQLFDVELEDRFVIRKFNRKFLSCGEFRILLFLRNRMFTEETFLEQKILLDDTRNRSDLDYAIMEVIEIFQSFVIDPVRIDKLVLTHQYICEIWKNGSKHLYFYTLHNQEHAIALIRNVVKLIHGVSFLKISSLDFYILFLACYLHDISMVKIPALDVFLTDREDGNRIAWEYILEMNREEADISQVKKCMVQSYRKLDAYYETKIREQHAFDSAVEIRTREDLNFLDDALREFVAEVSEAHQADERDIYFTKSSAAEKKISLKFDKILLRLADLLDMSNCRISRPILYHNLDQMSEESAFHWISHLLTQGYELETQYHVKPDGKCLHPQSIVEKLVLTVIVDISQLSKSQGTMPCEYMNIENINDNGFELEVGKKCVNGEENCNFLCRWFARKNRYLMQEFYALNEYLNRVPDNYFGSEIAVYIKIANRTSLDEKQFGVLKRYLS